MRGLTMVKTIGIAAAVAAARAPRHFGRWQSWSPWEKQDPAMKRVRSGPASGVGSIYAWESKEVGSGRMEIIESTPAAVRIKLDFTAPLEAHNVAEFVLRPEGGATRVTWTMQGPNSYTGKVMQTAFDIDQMVGRDFEAGLASLKTLTEG